nr:hypothetical protein [Tanacetum cinerariifolium]
MNADELPEMDPYEEVTQQGQAHPLSLAYVPDPMELDEHVEDDDDDPEEDPEKDPSEEHEPEDDDKDPEEDPNEEHESKGSDETEPFKEDKIVVTPPLSRHRGARISIRPQTPMAASTQALIDAFSSGSSPFPLPPTSHAYDQAQLGRRAAMIHKKDDILVEDMPPRRIFALTGPSPGCDVAESSAAAAVRAPRSQYDFVDTVEAGQGLIRSPGHDTRTIARAADRAEDASYVRRQESKNFYTQLLDAKTDRKDIRLEIDVVRGQRIAYETELQEVHQAYLSSEARNKELLARLETLETYKSRMEWQRQSAEDLAVTQMMRIYTLEARAHADTVEDADSSYSRTIMPVTRQGTNDAMTPESIQAMIDRAIQRNSTPTQDDVSQSSGEGLRRPVQPARVCSYTNFMKCQPLNFKGTEGVVRLSQWLEKMESVFYISGCAVDNQTLDETIELANDLMDQKLHTYAERQNESKRKANDSPRNNQQQPHKKQNVARAYTAVPGKKKVYTGDLPLCTKCNYHHTGQCAPKCGKCKRYGHTTTDCRVNTNNNNNNNNNNNKNQKDGACYECGNTGHIKKNCPKLKNHGNGSENSVAQG